MKYGNSSWIEWISSHHANPSQLTHAVPVMWFIGTVLLFHALHAHGFCALVKWYTKRSRVHVCYRRARYQHSITSDRTVSFFLRWETFYFITSYENNNRIMTLTLNLSTSHLTADTESGQRVFLRHSFFTWTASDRSVNSFLARLLK